MREGGRKGLDMQKYVKKVHPSALLPFLPPLPPSLLTWEAKNKSGSTMASVTGRGSCS